MQDLGMQKIDNELVNIREILSDLIKNLRIEREILRLEGEKREMPFEPLMAMKEFCGFLAKKIGGGNHS